MNSFWKRAAATAAISAGMAVQLAGAASFDYMKSADEVAENPLTAYSTVYLGMPRADFGANFSVLPDWTYSSDASYTEKAERTTTNGGITVTEGLTVLAEGSAPNARVLAFDNYFMTKDKNTAKEMYSRLVSTVYANMESFPASQRGEKVTWVQGDVTVVVSFSGTKDKNGLYTVLLRRYNNRVLSA